MAKASNPIGLLCFLFSALPSVYSCDTNPKIERDTIKLSWPVCEYPIAEEPFYAWECVEGRKMQGVKVCVENIPDIPCSITDSVYRCFELEGVPKDTEVWLSFTKDDYVSRLVPVKTGKHDITACETNPEREKLNTGVASLFPPLVKRYTKKEYLAKRKDNSCDAVVGSVSPKSDYGEIVAIALEFQFDAQTYPIEGNPIRPVGETVVSVDPVSSNGSYKDRIYSDDYGVPCYQAQDDKRLLGNGLAYFTEVTPGEYVVKYDIPDDYFCIIASVMTDRMTWGFPTSQPQYTRVPVIKGHSTITTIKCYNKNPDTGTKDARVERQTVSIDSDAGS